MTLPVRVVRRRRRGRPDHDHRRAPGEDENRSKTCQQPPLDPFLLYSRCAAVVGAPHDRTCWRHERTGRGLRLLQEYDDAYPVDRNEVAIIRGCQVSVKRDVRLNRNSGRDSIRAAVLCVIIDINIMPHTSCSIFGFSAPSPVDDNELSRRTLSAEKGRRWTPFSVLPNH